MFGRATITLGIGPHSSFESVSMLSTKCHHCNEITFVYSSCIIVTSLSFVNRYVADVANDLFYAWLSAKP